MLCQFAVLQELGTDLWINQHLSPTQKTQLLEALAEHYDNFNGKPGKKISLAVHKVDMGEYSPNNLPTTFC